MAVRNPYNAVKPKLAQLAEHHEHGATMADLAAFLGISTSTLYKLKDDHADVAEAIKTARARADAHIESALFKRAMGYDYQELTGTKEADENGDLQIEHARFVTKHVPGDVTAQIFWLKNRRPDEWNDRRTLAIEDGADEIVTEQERDL